MYQGNEPLLFEDDMYIVSFATVATWASPVRPDLSNARMGPRLAYALGTFDAVDPAQTRLDESCER